MKALRRIAPHQAALRRRCWLRSPGGESMWQPDKRGVPRIFLNFSIRAFAPCASTEKARAAIQIVVNHGSIDGRDIPAVDGRTRYSMQFLITGGASKVAKLRNIRVKYLAEAARGEKSVDEGGAEAERRQRGAEKTKMRTRQRQEKAGGGRRRCAFGNRL